MPCHIFTMCPDTVSLQCFPSILQQHCCCTVQQKSFSKACSVQQHQCFCYGNTVVTPLRDSFWCLNRVSSCCDHQSGPVQAVAPCRTSSYTSCAGAGCLNWASCCTSWPGCCLLLTTRSITRGTWDLTTWGTMQVGALMPASAAAPLIVGIRTIFQLIIINTVILNHNNNTHYVSLFTLILLLLMIAAQNSTQHDQRGLASRCWAPTRCILT